MQHEEYQYLNLLEELLTADFKGDRTGTGTYSVFGRQMRFNLNDGETFPLLTTKKVYWYAVVHELLWLISGNTNIKYLQDNNVRIWDEWADEDGELGHVYGKQWREWKTLKTDPFDFALKYETIDQLADVIERIKKNPHDRRLIVSAWNVAEIDDMALPPCHMMFQFYSNNNKLSLHMYQRSCDMFLGVPFNIASYALLLMLVARVTGQQAHEFVWTGGDVHLYSNHIEQAKEQLTRKPYEFPKLVLNENVESIDDYKFEDILLDEYRSHSTIKAKVSV